MSFVLNYINDRLHIKLSTLLPAVVTAWVLSGCGSEQVAPETAKPVLVQQIVAAPLVQEYRLPGVLRAASRSELSFAAYGEVQSVQVDIGSRVQAGDVLAVLDPEPFELAVRAASATRLRAQSAYQERQANYQREQHLRADNATSQRSYEQALASLQDAEQALAEAQANQLTAERDLRRSVLRAPFAGTIAGRHIEPAMEVSPLQPVLLLDSDQPLQIDTHLPARLLDKVDVGTEVQVQLHTHASRQHGTISYIGGRASNGLSVPARVQLGNLPSSAVRPGLVAEVVIRSNHSEQVLTLPHAAIVPAAEQGKGYVYIYSADNSRIRLQPVTIVDTSAAGVVIRPVLAADTRIVTAGTAFLHDGQLVSAITSGKEIF